MPTSFEAIGTVHQLVCDGVKRPAWRTISTYQPNHNCKIQRKCNAQQYHQKFFHTLFSFFLMIPSLFCPHYTDWAGRYGCPSYTYHKKGTRHSHFECTVFLLSSFVALLLHKSQAFIFIVLPNLPLIFIIGIPGKSSQFHALHVIQCTAKHLTMDTDPQCGFDRRASS